MFEDVFIDDLFYQYIIVYQVQLFLTLLSLFINFLLAIYVYSNDVFQPYKMIFRVIIISDILSNICCFVDAFTILINCKF